MYRFRQWIDDLTGCGDRHGVCLCWQNQNPNIMSQDPMERLKALEARVRKEKYDEQQRQIAADQRKQEQEVRLERFWIDVISVAMNLAQERLKDNGWELYNAHHSFHKPGEKIFVARLKRMDWSVTLTYTWDQPGGYLLSYRFGEPRIKGLGSSEYISIDSANADTVRDTILTCIEKACEFGARGH